LVRFKSFNQSDPKWNEARADPRIAAVLLRCGFTAAA